jgi:hypothetical protein
MVEWPTQIGLLWPARVYDAVAPTALVAGPSNQQMATQISDITRRDLREVLAKIKWWGRLGEPEFLQRLYALDDLPSLDPRYKTAEQDIYQHRINNEDWPNDWVFTDDRFGMGNGEDEELLRFLTEMLHPAVRHEREAEEIIERLNPLLRADGYTRQRSWV